MGAEGEGGVCRASGNMCGAAHDGKRRWVLRQSGEGSTGLAQARAQGERCVVAKPTLSLFFFFWINAPLVFSVFGVFRKLFETHKNKTCKPELGRCLLKFWPRPFSARGSSFRRHFFRQPVRPPALGVFLSSRQSVASRRRTSFGSPACLASHYTVCLFRYFDGGLVAPATLAQFTRAIHAKQARPNVSERRRRSSHTPYFLSARARRRLRFLVCIPVSLPSFTCVAAAFLCLPCIHPSGFEFVFPRSSRYFHSRLSVSTLMAAF